MSRPRAASPVLVLLVWLLAPSASWACERGEPGEQRLAQGGDSAAISELTQGSNYTIVHPRAEVRVAETGQLELRVTAGSGFKVNVEYPWRLTLESDAPVTLPQLDFRAADAAQLTEEAAVFSVPVTPSAAGVHEVDGRLRFSVCNDVRCDVLQADVSWAVSAE
jgi:hypothetical protein